MGRKTKLTPEVQKNILDALSVGATHRIACQYAGINPQSFYNWLDKGEAGQKLYVDFFEQVIQTQGRAAVGWLAKIEAAANEGDWRAVAWKLERRYPHEYGKTVQERMNLDLNAATDEQLERLANGESIHTVFGQKNPHEDTT